MIQQNGLSGKSRGLIHRELGRCYATLDPDKALAHYAAAVKARPETDYALEMADVLIGYGRYADAEVLRREWSRPIPRMWPYIDGWRPSTG